MRKPTILISVVLVAIFLLSSCSSKVDNGITFFNYSATTVYVNFMGELTQISPSMESLIQIPPEEKVELTELFRGTY